MQFINIPFFQAQRPAHLIKKNCIQTRNRKNKKSSVMPSVEDEETGQVNLSSNTTTTANNNIIQFWNVIPLSAKYISTIYKWNFYVWRLIRQSHQTFSDIYFNIGYERYHTLPYLLVRTVRGLAYVLKITKEKQHCIN